ncbi:hypothetical protein LOK49_LG04G02057 [Camellia lanceoleosa]|uniref:Uncharacterized protein n=1 Tax=Camellia lanceoleosa TaxID=1840588 RepID=A0ACC0I0E0_9ERIC|nr:hypothetical protein LOK49_LG04G02057 [Camellia lanceoleosa]
MERDQGKDEREDRNDQQWTKVERSQKSLRKYFTIFIANIPDAVSVKSLKGIFQRFGKVIHALIPDRRTKHFNSIFGFIRYERQELAKEEVRKITSAWYDEFKLFVKPTRFDKPFRQGFHDNQRTLQQKSLQKPLQPSFRAVNKRYDHHILVGKRPFYEDAVKGTIKTIDPKTRVMWKKLAMIGFIEVWWSQLVYYVQTSP